MIVGPSGADIAIVGVSALFPGSVTTEGFWRRIFLGEDLITDVPPTHWLLRDYYDPNPSAEDKTYASRGSFLPDIDFNPIEFGIPPTNLSSTDTSQLLALVVAKRVLEDAVQGRFEGLDRDRVSVILGVASATELVGEMSGRLQRPVWEQALRSYGMPEDHIKVVCDAISNSYAPWNESTFPGLLGNVVAGRIANRLNLGGTNTVLDAACASSLSAVAMAVMELQLGHSDLVITGGVDALNDIFMYMCFSKTPALSMTGDCRPFSDRADGTMLGEGIGMFAMKRIADAERDGDHIYAVIKGVGSSSDGQSKSVYAPNAPGQATALTRTYERAGYRPDTVELVEAHGTGTKAGDAAEFEGLQSVFGRYSDGTQWCALGSVKSQIGHTKAAAGSAGLFKAVMALNHKILPPTIKIERPNPLLNIESSPFYLNTATRPWIRNNLHPRRASVSAFGFGGSNFHVTLEEYTGPNQALRFPVFPTQLLLWSATTAEELIEMCRGVLAVLNGADGTEDLSRLARKAQAGFSVEHPLRLAIVAADSRELMDRLNEAIEHLVQRPDAAINNPKGIYYTIGVTPGQVAFLFPGQGSQYVNMGADVVMAFEDARTVWDESGAQHIGSQLLHQAVFPRPALNEQDASRQSEQLTLTNVAQPAIGLASLSLLRLLQGLGVQPDCLGGHSFGEVTALHAAGVFSEPDFLSIAQARGRLMAEASGEAGTMTAVSDNHTVIGQLIANHQLDIVVANYNSPRQCVVSGKVSDMDAFEALLKSASIRYQRLSVATAFHSPLVAPAVGSFADHLAQIEFRSPEKTVFANSTAEPYSGHPDDLRQLLAGQIEKPVRFEQQITAMADAGVKTFIEVGPGAVLTGLVRQCVADESILAISMNRRGVNGVTALWHALARLSVQGIAMDFHPLWRGYKVPEAKPITKSPLTVRINGSNYGRPYPHTDPTVTDVKWNHGARKDERPLDQEPPQKADIPLKSGPASEAESLPEDKEPLQPYIQSAPPSALPDQMAKESIMTTNPMPQASILQTFHELQRQTAEAHMVYQQSMAQSHAAFLSASEKTFLAFAQLLSGQSIDPALQQATPGYAIGQPLQAAPSPFPSQPSPTVQPVFQVPTPSFVTIAAQPEPAQYIPAPPMAVPSASHAAFSAATTMPVVHDAVAASSPMTDVHTAQAQIAAVVEASGSDTADEVDITGLMLSVVAEKTGYPAEMLGSEMDLESDLGIDSIKRVEILSAVQDKLKGSFVVDAQEMATLRTMGEIIAYIDNNVKKN